MQPHARSIIALIVASDPRYRFALAVSGTDRGCMSPAGRPHCSAKAKEYHQLADIAASDGARRRYRHLAHTYQCLAGEFAGAVA